MIAGRAIFKQPQQQSRDLLAGGTYVSTSPPLALPAIINRLGRLLSFTRTAKRAAHPLGTASQR